MIRVLSYLIAVVSIVSALTGLVAFSIDHGDWLKEKTWEIISMVYPANPPSVAPPGTNEPADCSAIPDMAERIFCINKQKERDECARTNCRPIKGHAAKV
jgi:hypothetical protein